MSNRSMRAWRRTQRRQSVGIHGATSLVQLECKVAASPPWAHVDYDLELQVASGASSLRTRDLAVPPSEKAQISGRRYMFQEAL